MLERTKEMKQVREIIGDYAGVIIIGTMMFGAYAIGYKTGVKITDLKTLNGLAALFNENPECRKLFIQTAEQIEAKRKR